MDTHNYANKIKGILWKKLTATDAQALLNYSYETGGGAKHLPFRKNLQIGVLIGDENRTGGSDEYPEYAISVTSPQNAVKYVHIDYILRGQTREEWLVRRQNGPEQIPAWKPGVKLPNTYDEIPGNYILLFRLEDDSFHARVATKDEMDSFPDDFKAILQSGEQGVETNIQQNIYLDLDVDSDFIQDNVDNAGTIISDEEAEVAAEEEQAPAAEEEERIETRIRQDEEISETEKETLIKARKGQGRFRDDVIALHKKCPFTGVSNPIFLTSSHIKPWAKCSDNHERLDPLNGLPLTPVANQLFDRGLVTFNDDGQAIFSDKIAEEDLERMGISTHGNYQIEIFDAKQIDYLKYHRDNVFIK